MSMRPHLRTLLSAALLAACALPGLAAPMGLYALPVTWQDDQGRSVHLADWAQRPVVITMAYGTCRKVCSTSIRRMTEVQEKADAMGLDVEFVVVSLDPKADSPQAWEAFRKLKKLDRRNWHFIRGSDANTHTLARLLGIGYWVYDEHVVHDFRVLRLNPQGEIAAALTLASDDPASLLSLR